MAPNGESPNAARERRRQANRESARRSRFLKQMEVTQLRDQLVALTHEFKSLSEVNKTLVSENIALKTKLGMFLGPEDLSDYLRYLADADADTDEDTD